MTFSNRKANLDKQLILFYNFLNENRYVQRFLFVSFALLLLILIKNHTPWRDDARPILIATNNNSFFDFYNELRYESTPGLYHLFLWLMNKVIPLTITNIKALFYIINLLILITIIFLVKIPNIYRLIILLQAPTVGYMCYIRQYSWTVLFLFLFTFFYQKNQDKKFSLYLILFLLTQTCFHGCIITFALYIFILGGRLNEKKNLFNLYDLLIYFGVVLCGLQMLQPPDIIQNLKIVKFWSFQQIYDFLLIFISQTFLITLISGYGLCIMTYLTLKKLSKENIIFRNTFIFIISFVTISFFSIGIFRHYSFDRHHWLLSYLIIILLILLNKNLPHKINSIPIKYYLLFILLFGCMVNFPSLIKRYAITQSTSNKVAQYLDKYFPNKPTLNEFDFMTDAINPQRKQQKYFYSLNTGRWGKYSKWNHPRTDFFEYYKEGGIYLRTSTIIKDLENTPDLLLEKEPLLILCAEKFINDNNTKLKTLKIKKKYKLKFIKEFPGSSLESFAIFIIDK